MKQSQIYNISSKLFDGLPRLLDAFHIEYVEYPNRYSFACPVHGGDNPEGCSIFTDGDSIQGNWTCWTRKCEDEFSNHLFGFVRGVLSFSKGEEISLDDTASYCTDLFKINVNELNSSHTENHTVKLSDVFNRDLQRQSNDVTRESIRSRIKMPAQYYMNRGFCPKVLDLFDVGLCIEKNRPMFERVVVPIYDEDYNYVGCVGRATSSNMEPKWLHSKGFKKSVLYGLNVAKADIKKYSTVILVEGQGDVWKMHQAGYTNCVGIFGSSLNSDQLILLEKSGALNIVILTDYDEAGTKAVQQIMKKCGRRFNYYRPQISSKDVGDMSVEKIHEELKPQLERIV